MCYLKQMVLHGTFIYYFVFFFISKHHYYNNTDIEFLVVTCRLIIIKKIYKFFMYHETNAYKGSILFHAF